MMTNNQQAQITEKLTGKRAIEIDSLQKALMGESQPWLTDGFDWIDKPHRVMWKAIEEICALRKYIINNLTPPNK